MSETKPDYEIGYGKPPPGRRFQKGQSGNPRGSRPKSLPVLLVNAERAGLRHHRRASAREEPS